MGIEVDENEGWAERERGNRLGSSDIGIVATSPPDG
jgi:hypothetical protein